MLKRLREWFTPQDLNDRDVLAQFKVLNSVVLIALVGAIGTIGATVAFESTPQARMTMILLAALLFVSFILLRRRVLFPAQVVAPLSLFGTITFIAAIGSGLHDIALIAYAGVIIAASLTLGKRAMFAMSGLIVVTVFAFWWAESTGALVTDASALTTPDDPFLISIVVLAITLTQAVLINRDSRSLQLARDNEKAQIEINKELLELKNSLEKRVMERTEQLEASIRQNTRRAAQFESIAQTSRAMTSLQSLSELLPRITKLISQQFGFYHVGIFLVDDVNEYAVLAAANSPGGERMVQRGHKLKVGQVGIVGYVAGSGAPRIALDTGADAAYFDNPDLPETHSEMALPLKSGGNVIGVLDVQSTERSAFTNEDIASLSILADQVSIAIENTRKYEATLRSIEKTETAYRQYVQREWAQLMQEENLAGYRYSTGSSARLNQPVNLGEAAKVVSEGRIYQQPDPEAGGMAELAVPVKLRGEVVGILSVSAADKARWSDDDIDIVEAVVERLALSIENARLFQVANKRAERERIVSDIASRISGNIRIESLLRATAQELSQAMSGSEVLIQLQTPNQPGGRQ
ncbi:MAG: GAF domain-containing protein [Chloroflexota bacterium]